MPDERIKIMRKYIILAETGADIPSELTERYGIYTVPMHVSFGAETKDDGSFPIDDVFDYYKKSGKLPRTSGCNVLTSTGFLMKYTRNTPQAVSCILPILQ